MNEKILKMMDEGKLPARSFPGGYPIVYLDGYDGTLCANCASTAVNERMDLFEEYIPQDYFLHMDGEMIFCDVCGDPIESAYGIPEEVG